jgi:hypothetical protein
MDLATCMAHDKYCLGRKDVKLCCMCKNKQVSDHLDSLPVDQCVELKESMSMIDAITCKVTNASYYVSAK